MPLIPFPKIPQVADAMILSGAMCTAYNRGLRYLLGESHAPYSTHEVGPTLELENSDNAWHTVWTGYIYLRAKTNATLYWGYLVKWTGSSTNWSAKLEFYSDDETWDLVFEETGTDAAYSWETGSKALSGEAITANTIYKLRLQLKTEDDMSFRLYYFTEALAIQGWQGLDTHSEDDESHVDDFNDIRTDLNALNTTLSPVNPLARARYGAASDGISSSYRIAMRVAYCYRPHHLYCGIELHQDNPSGGREYQWKVDFIDENDQSAEIYESAETESPSEWFWDFEEIDLTAGDAATALTGAGITLSLGSYYRVKISARRSSGSEELSIRGAIVARTSDQDPDGSWDDPADWAHGDNDVGPTNMNIYKTDLLLLYSGNEKLYPRTHAHGYTDDEVRTFTGIHRKRWLWYLRVPDETATLHFGADFDEDFDLDDDDSGDWQKQDLTEVEIAWGSYYRISGCQCVMENDNG